MSIIGFLMSDRSVRVTYEDKWLVYDDTTEEWVVYQKPPYAKNVRVLCRTLLQDEAVAAMIGDESDDPE